MNGNSQVEYIDFRYMSGSRTWFIWFGFYIIVLEEFSGLVARECVIVGKGFSRMDVKFVGFSGSFACSGGVLCVDHEWFNRFTSFVSV